MKPIQTELYRSKPKRCQRRKVWSHDQAMYLLLQAYERWRNQDGTHEYRLDGYAQLHTERSRC
jgi:hypothetical protein